jgi:hypothetical protein
LDIRQRRCRSMPDGHKRAAAHIIWFHHQRVDISKPEQLGD